MNRQRGHAAGDGDVLQLRAERDAALKAAQGAMRDTTRLTRLLTALSEPAPLDALFDQVLCTLSELFSADIVVLLDPAGTGDLVPRAAIGLPEDVAGLPFGAEGGPLNAVIHGRHPVLTGHAAADEDTDPRLREQGVETAVWVPVTDTQSVRGALILARCRPEPFLHSDADLLVAMAYRIGLALEQAQRSAQLERAVAAAQEIAGHLDESEVQTELVRLMPGVVSADAAVLMIVAADGAPRWVAQQGLPNVLICEWEQLTRRLLADGWLSATQPYTTPDLRTATDWPPALTGCPIRALLGVPIRRGDGAAGVLYAVRFSTNPFTPDTIQVAMLYAGQASAALENARLYRAVRDELGERVRAEHELRESEERLKLALTGGRLGMWDWRPPTGIVRVNECWSQMTGDSEEEAEITEDAFLSRLHPEDRASFLAVVSDREAWQAPMFEIEHRLVSRSGQEVWVLARGRITERGEVGQPLRIVGTVLDITEARQVQAERLEIEQQKQQVWRAESLTRMAGGIAHHFNNFLGAVIGNLELALEEIPRDSACGHRIEEAADGAWRAAEVSRLMLAYLGQTGGRRDAIDIADSARQAVSLLLPKFPHNVRLHTDFPEAGPTVLAQGVHIKQILDNLVSNALEAIGGREGEVRIAVRKIAPGELRVRRLVPPDWSVGAGEYVCLSIGDNGPGIDPANESRIFDPFFSTKFTGRGLGLSVVLGLVRAYGGALAVDSKPGKGATFRLIFPVAAGATSPEAAVSTPVRPSPTPSVVLVVDDEPMVVRVARAQLERLGYQVLTAGDGIQGLDVFRARAADIGLVLLDLAMPHMDGWATLAGLRELEPDIRVILASGYDEAQVMEGDHPHRPQAFLQKPYDMKDLQRAVALATA